MLLSGLASTLAAASSALVPASSAGVLAASRGAFGVLAASSPGTTELLLASGSAPPASRLWAGLAQSGAHDSSGSGEGSLQATATSTPHAHDQTLLQRLIALTSGRRSRQHRAVQRRLRA
jgi:hypothetical protein